MVNLTRRQFLKALAASAVAVSVPIPAFGKTRQPYVKVGEVVSYIGHSPNPKAFIGANIVHAVGKWDGHGYPVELNIGSDLVQTRPFNLYKQRVVKGFYDFDLANFNRELPERFWQNPKHKIYPNVHTYVRVQRYGETVAGAVKHMNLSLSGKWRPA